MLRCAAEGRELTYTSVVGAVRRGPKPPRLEPRSWKGSPYEFREQIRESVDEPSSRSRRRPHPRNLSQIEDEAEKQARGRNGLQPLSETSSEAYAAQANPLTAIRA
jgi:hypothetical protein